jgi:hypothetical protein
MVAAVNVGVGTGERSRHCDICLAHDESLQENRAGSGKIDKGMSQRRSLMTVL